MKLKEFFILEEEEGGEEAPRTDTPRITTAQAIDLIANSGGRIFDVTFRKRTDNTIRKMNAKIDTEKGIYWKDVNFDMEEKGLIGVQDLKKEKGGVPRMISRESIRSLRIDGKKYLVTPEQI